MIPALAIPCGHPVRPQKGQFEVLTTNPKKAAQRKRKRVHKALSEWPNRPGGALAISESTAWVVLGSLEFMAHGSDRHNGGLRRARRPSPPRLRNAPGDLSSMRGLCSEHLPAPSEGALGKERSRLPPPSRGQGLLFQQKLTWVHRDPVDPHLVVERPVFPTAAIGRPRTTRPPKWTNTSDRWP